MLTIVFFCFPDSGALKEKFMLWKTKLLKIDKNIKPLNTLPLLSDCNSAIYANIRKILKILITLSKSTVTAKRTFFSLHRIITCLRSTISKN